MTDHSITLQKPSVDDLERIETLLEANDLPSRDVRSKQEDFFVATAGTDRIGVGGVEIRGSDGLLRSVAIEESHRGQGYGTALCEALEAAARSDGVETLYLLTTTAAGFFRTRGYEEIDREDVPGRIRETSEFTDLCPSSAVCMRKDIDR